MTPEQQTKIAITVLILLVLGLLIYILLRKKTKCDTCRICPPTLLGCYIDASAGVPDKNGVKRILPNMLGRFSKLEDCAKAAADKNYSFFGMENNLPVDKNDPSKGDESECWASDDSTYIQQAAMSKINCTLNANNDLVGEPPGSYIAIYRS